MTNGHKILIVNDEPGALVLFKLMLNRAGWSNVQTAGSGKEALQILKDFGPTF